MAQWYVAQKLSVLGSVCSHFLWVFSTLALLIHSINKYIFPLIFFLSSIYTLYAHAARNWDADAAEKMLREVCNNRLKQANTKITF